MIIDEMAYIGWKKPTGLTIMEIRDDYIPEDYN